MSEVGYALHNQEAGRLIRELIKPTLAAGGTMNDVLILLESVLLGFVLMTVKMGGDEAVLDTLMAGVKTRLAEQRLGPIEPAGRA